MAKSAQSRRFLQKVAGQLPADVRVVEHLTKNENVGVGEILRLNHTKRR